MSQAIDDVLKRAVDRGAVPNVVAVAADRSGVTYRGAAGAIAPDDDPEFLRDLDRKRRQRDDSDS